MSAPIEEEMKSMTLAEIPKKKTQANEKKIAAPKEKRAPSAWMLHIKATQETEGCGYGEAMKLASKTYKKKTAPIQTDAEPSATQPASAEAEVV